MTERIPAEVFPLAECIGDEMLARGWNTDDLAIAMGGTEDDIAFNILSVVLLLSVQREGLLIGERMLNGLTVAFDVDPEFFRNIDKAWRDAPANRRSYYSPPEELFGPISRRGFMHVV